MVTALGTTFRATAFELRRNDPAPNEDEEAVRELFADFFEKECPPEVVRAAEPLGHSPELWVKVVELGATTMGLPVEVDGEGASLVDLVLLAEEWGRRLAPVPLAGHVACSRALAAFGPSEALTAAMSGKRILALAPTPVRGAAPQLVPDAAVATDVLALVGDELILHHGIPGPLVPNQGDTPLAAWSPAGADEGVVLASGPEAAASHQHLVKEWKLLMAAALNGLGVAALELGVEFARTRESMGVPIGALQGVAYPLVDARIDLANARTLVHKAAWLAEREPGVYPHLPVIAHLAARQAANRAATVSVHTQGGLGFMTEADVSLYFLRAKGWGALSGDPAPDLVRIGADLVASLDRR